MPQFFRPVGCHRRHSDKKVIVKTDQKLTHLVNLIAEAGIGKSRLLFEFGKWLDDLGAPVQIFKGRASQETSQIPFSLLRGILSSSFEIQENDRASVARKKLENGVRRFTNDSEVAEQYAHFIGHLIGLDYSTSNHLKGILSDARQVRDRAFHAFEDAAAHRGAQRIDRRAVDRDDGDDVMTFEFYHFAHGTLPHHLFLDVTQVALSRYGSFSSISHCEI